jgi:acyl-coenzyme A thioesterase PaaI-like protein
MVDIDELLAAWQVRHEQYEQIEVDGPIPPHHDHCLGCGPQNAHGFQIEVRATETGVHLRHAFDKRHVGAPGLVHGGAVAAVIDDLFGFLLFKAGGPAVTRQLTVDYLAPLQLEVVYDFNAAIDTVDGRKLNVTAAVSDSIGTTVATASALFIMVDIDHFRTASVK